MTGLIDALKDATWHNEPPNWVWENGVLVVTTGDKTDFWQTTHYGFRRDDGHFLGRAQTGDFTALLTFEADYKTLYEQAGLMLRRDEHNWLKAGIEYSDGITNFSVVITRNGRSDWSVIGVPDLRGPQQIRITRVGGAVIVHHMTRAGTWQLMRLGDFDQTPVIDVGPMACSPESRAFVARFLDLEIGPPIQNPLHSA